MPVTIARPTFAIAPGCRWDTFCGMMRRIAGLRRRAATTVGSGVNPTSRLVAGGAGLLFVALTVIPPLIVGVPPPAGASAAAVVMYYTSGREALLAAAWIGAVGIVPSFVFFACIVAIVREAEGEAGWLWLLALLGLAGAFVTVIVLTALAAILPYSAATISPPVAQVFSDLSGLTLVIYFFPIAVFFGAVGYVLATRGGLPPQLGVAGLAVAVVSLLATVGIFVDWGPLKPGAIITLSVFALQVAWWGVASLALLAPALGRAVGR
jgi:hypothetical protein